MLCFVLLLFIERLSNNRFNFYTTVLAAFGMSSLIPFFFFFFFFFFFNFSQKIGLMFHAYCLLIRKFA